MSTVPQPPQAIVERAPTKWSTFLQLMKMCGECCYVICPPVPELVTRKLAFHPPARGLTYTIRLKQEGAEPKNAKDLLGKEFELQLTCNVIRVTAGEVAEVMETVETFVVTTMFHNHLIGVKISPSRSSTRSSPPFLSSRHNGPEQVILFSQPNSSDLGHLLHPAGQVFQRMADDLGVDVYAYDYSGYGYSTGSASEKNIYADVQAMYDYIRRTRPNVRIVLVGFSIGTTASVHLAAQKPDKLAGVVLLAAFFSGMSLLRRQKDPRKADDFCDRFRNIDRIHDITAPVLLIHGANDELVPIEHSQEMYKILQKPVAPLYVYGANHSTILSHPFTNLRLMRFLLAETDLGPFLSTGSRS